MNIDAIIVFGYLLLTLILGLYWGRGVKNISDYALGGRNFSTSVLSTTIIATYASASGFFVQISRSYDDGIYMLIGFVGQLIGILFFAYYVSRKMDRFVGKLSVAEMMGDLYGKNLRILSSLPIFLVSGGLVAVQIKVLSSTMAYFTNINDLLCIVITALVIIIYSAFGGVRAVTNTDYVQFLTFAVAIPIIFLIVYSSLELPNNQANKQDLIDHLFKLDQQKFPHYAILFIYFVVPSFSPPIIQRMLMAKNTHQIYRSFEIAAITLFAMATLSCIIGGMIHVSNPNLENKEVFGYLIDNYTYPGLKGLLLIGILALAMSTADSNLNAGAVSFSHDLC